MILFQYSAFKNFQMALLSKDAIKQSGKSHVHVHDVGFSHGHAEQVF